VSAAKKRGQAAFFPDSTVRKKSSLSPFFRCIVAAAAVCGCERKAVAPDAGEAAVVQDAGGVWHLRGHRQPLYAVAVSSDGAHGATGGGDRTVRVWDLKRPAEAFSVGGGNEAITALAFSPSGDLLAVGDRAFTVRVIRVSDGAVLRAWPHPDSISTVDFSPDGRWLAVAGFQGNAAVYAVDHAGPAKCDWRGRTAQFTDGGTRVVVANGSGALA